MNDLEIPEGKEFFGLELLEPAPIADLRSTNCGAGKVDDPDSGIV